jgi:hypothetical protein
MPCSTGCGEFGLARNYYDRLGHVAQGVVPAMLAREVLIRSRVVNGRGWLFLLTCCVALAISACYEFFEWWVAVASGTAADAFLATQGDVWDTQWDMFLALCGAITAQLLLNRWHDRQLRLAWVKRKAQRLFASLAFELASPTASASATASARRRRTPATTPPRAVFTCSKPDRGARATPADWCRCCPLGSLP